MGSFILRYMIFKVWPRRGVNPAEIKLIIFLHLQLDVKNPWTFGYIDIHKEMCLVCVCVSDVCMCAYVRLIL